MQRYQTEDIDLYMNEIRKLDRITVAEEVELFHRMHSGTEAERAEARDRLITTNLRLVVKIAHDFKHTGLGFADLVSEGNMGLLLAADKFDPAKGAKFSCYAAWWIKQAMRKAISWQSKMIRIPGGSAHKIANMTKARARFAAEFGREPDEDELAALTGYGTATIRVLGKAAVETMSMNETVSDDSSTTFETVLSERADDTAETRARADGVHKVLDNLSELDRMVVAYSFGIGCTAKGQAEISKETGLSLAGIAERLSSALAKMRNALGEEFLSECATV